MARKRLRLRVRARVQRLAAIVAVGVGASAPVFAMGLDPAFEGPAIGPAKAKGVIVWSHGRSINTEDSESPSPAYLTALRDDGWDAMRFDRLSQGDTLSDSTKRLVEYTAQLKRDGHYCLVGLVSVPIHTPRLPGQSKPGEEFHALFRLYIVQPVNRKVGEVEWTINAIDADFHDLFFFCAQENKGVGQWFRRGTIRDCPIK